MKTILILFFCFTGFAARALSEETVDFNMRDKPIVEVLDMYSKLSGQKFMVAPSVGGKITILSPSRVALPEAFRLLASALAANGLTYVPTPGSPDVYQIESSRNAQRSSLEVVTALPTPPQPDHLLTYVRTLRYVAADEVNKNLRILNSKDGESVVLGKDRMIFTDFLSNLYRIEKILSAIDIPKRKVQ